MPQSSATVAPSRARKTRSNATLDKKWDLNSCNPVSRMPAEVLLLTFIFVRFGYQEAKEELAKQRQEHGRFVDEEIENFVQIGWMGVSQVCRRWREAALGSASLWSHIVVEDRNCRWATEMLKRSKKSPLTIYLDLYIMDKRSRHKRTRTAVARSTLANVQKQMARCKELKITPDPYKHFSLESALTGYPMPELSSLTIEVECVVNAPETLSNDMLKADSLHILKLSNVQLDWNSKFLLGLTSLTFHPHMQTITMPCLLDHLAMIPTLKQLDLKLYCVPDQSEIQLTHDHPLKSQPLELTHLSITGFPIPATILLQCVVRNVYLDICVVQAHEETEEDMAALLTAISGHILGVEENERSLRQCAIHHPVPDRFMLVGHSSGSPSLLIRNRGDDAEAHLNLSIMYKAGTGPGGPAIIRTVFQHLPLRHLLTLSFTHNYPFSSTDWLSTFGTIPTLKVLSLDTRHPVAFFEAFSEDAFPVLKTISCTNSDLLLRKFHTSPLLQSLLSRHKGGSPLKSLELNDAKNLSAKNKQTLQSLVGDLHVYS